MRLLHTVVALLIGAAPGWLQGISPAWAGDVEVRVVNVRGAAGSIRAEICQASEWLKDGCRHKAVAAAVAGTTTVTLKDVAPGTWAIVAFHDRANDGEVARNVLGIPTEGIGFSRNPSLGLHGPSFASSALVIGAQGAVVDIHLTFE